MAGSPIASLQSEDHKILMDTIDKLRSQGISRYVDLPQIVVCGDQSSGKSSVLQAISGLGFPIKDNVCTRFATELVLRQVSDVSEKCRVSIQPGDERTEDEKEKLANFQHYEAPEKLDVAALIEQAKVHMGIGEGNRTFSTDILRIEVTGPAQPNLTIVDLPGLFRAGNKEQSEEDADTVRALVRSYMSKSLSIILAVVSAKSDFTLQEVTQLAREIDRHGLRTLGLVTKPDTLDVGSDSEDAYLKLVQNRDVEFRLGWHVLRNRDYRSRDVTNEERDRQERAFFTTGAWTAIPWKHKGVVSLRSRLSDVLTNQILVQLPDLSDKVESELQGCTLALDKLGAPRATIEEQRRYISHASYQFATIMRDAIGGSYNDGAFFGNIRDHAGHLKRLRAVVQNRLTDFAKTMRLEGHAKNIVERLSEDGEREVLRSKYLAEVKELMRHSRGCELPGTYNPLIVGSLFREQCDPWKGHLEKYSDDILRDVHHMVNAVLNYVVDENTRTRLWDELIEAKLEGLKSALTSKTEEILTSHLSRHPITYNKYLTENIHKAQQQRTRKQLEEQLKPFEVNGTFSPPSRVSLPLTRILDIFTAQAEADMEIFASAAATDVMQAYYKVALERIVDDFSDLAVEACLVSKLPQIFSPDVIIELSDATVQRITSENEQVIQERLSLTQKKGVLLAGLAELKRLSRHRQPISLSESASGMISLAQFEDFGVHYTPSPPVILQEHTDSISAEPVFAESLSDEFVPEIPPQTVMDEDDWAPVLTTSKKDKKKKKRYVGFSRDEPPPEPEDEFQC